MRKGRSPRRREELTLPTAKGVARAESRRKRRVRLIQTGIAVGVVVLVVICLVVSTLMRKLDGTAGGDSPDDPAGLPAGFAVVDQPIGAPANAEQGQPRNPWEWAKKLADQAPAFDPAQTLTMRSTLGHLLQVGNVPEPLALLCEKRFLGEPLPPGSDTPYVDQLLRGQGVRTGTDPAAEKNAGGKTAWNPIPIDTPSTPFKLGLSTGIPVEPVGGIHRITGILNSPYYVPFPWWMNYWNGPRAYTLIPDPRNKKLLTPKIEQPRPPHPIIDLRSGKTVGEFDWLAPIWDNVRLSRDGGYLVGPYPFASLERLQGSATEGEAGKNLLYIWAKGKKPSVSFPTPGLIDWMEFVGGDRLAYLMHTNKAVLHLHDVARNQPIGAIELPGVEKGPYPDAQFEDTALTLGFYRPMSRRGAVSPNGRYVAIGSPDGVRLISIVDARVVGLLSIPQAREYGGLNFSPDGTRLSGLVLSSGPAGDSFTFRSWSVATGQPLEQTTADRHRSGPFFPGPLEGLYVSNQFFFTGNPTPAEEAPFKVLGVDDGGMALVIGPIQQAPPDTPLLPSIRESIKAGQTSPDAANNRTGLALFATKVDWSRWTTKLGPLATLMNPRPEARPGDRAGLTPSKPIPPGTWTAPPFAGEPKIPEESADPNARHQFGDWPLSFAEEKAALIRYVARVQHRYRYEVLLDLVDARTGARAAPTVKLWDWAHFPTQPGQQEEGAVQDWRALGAPPLPALCALRADAGLLALVDPNEARRVDLFKPTGEWQMGLVPSADHRVDWIGWSPRHLLTVSGGRLTVWEPSTGKALAEVDGGYTHVAQLAPNRRWIALWTGKYADLLDTTTGQCLGRCLAGGFAGQLETFALSPNGKRLVASFTGWPKDLPPSNPGPGNTAVVWNLETGKAGLYGFAAFALDGRGLAPRLTCAWMGNQHLLVSGRSGVEQMTLFDLHLGRTVGTYELLGGGSLNHLPLRNSPDGRLWFPTNALVRTPPGFNPNNPNHEDFPNGFVWQTLRVPGGHGQESYLTDPERSWIDTTAFPVQVHAKVGSAAQNAAYAKGIAQQLQSQGWKIGPGGRVLRVEGTMQDTQELVTFSLGTDVPIPACALSAQWLSAEGTILWKTNSTHPWNSRSSKYRVMKGAQPGGMKPFEEMQFDFQGISPRKAMCDELTEGVVASGGQSWIKLPELQFLRAGGENRLAPLRGKLLLVPGG